MMRKISASEIFVATVFFGFLSARAAFCEELLELWINGKYVLGTSQVKVVDGPAGKITVDGRFNRDELYYETRDSKGAFEFRLFGKSVATQKPGKTIEDGVVKFVMPAPTGGAKTLQLNIDLKSGTAPYDSNFVYLGTLEVVPPIGGGDTSSIWIFPYFRAKDSKWYSLAENESAYPGKTPWTISFRGNSLREEKVNVPLAVGRGGDRGYHLYTSQKVPKKGEEDRVNSKDLSAEALPNLVAVSKPNFKDPDQWISMSDTRKFHAGIVKEFRKLFPKVENCESEESNSKPWTYSDKNIKLSNPYSSAKGDVIVTVELTGARCGFRLDYQPFETHAFAIDSKGKIRHLGVGLSFLDAGDYDSDGKSELLFKVDRYNRYGYVLFYQDFSEKVQRTHSLH